MSIDTMDVSSRKTTASMSLTSYQRGQLAHLRSIVLRQQRQQQQQQQPSTDPTTVTTAGDTAAAPAAPTDTKESAIEVADASATAQSASKHLDDINLNPPASNSSSSAANDAKATIGVEAKVAALPDNDHDAKHQPPPPPPAQHDDHPQRQLDDHHPSETLEATTATAALIPAQHNSVQTDLLPTQVPVAKKTKLS
jgi:hypothetical protein